MLSILIPTYNSPCLPLVENVYAQASALGIAFEILLADDASHEDYKTENRKINQWSGCRYLELSENKGPACIRNYLAKEARFQYLLYLDSDTMPVSDTFLSDYLQAACPQTAVCGGFVYPRQQPEATVALRYYYGIGVEEQLAEERSKQPYHHFISMNFLIDKACFEQTCFDETFHLGYEDTLFGMQLGQAGIPIRHIDNPVYHLVTETSEQFLVKIRRAVRNLNGHVEQMQSHVRLLTWYLRIRRMGLTWFVAFIFRRNEKGLERNLTSPHPSLKLFAFYKLGYLCTLRLR